jgi:hypothetical protein
MLNRLLAIMLGGMLLTLSTWSRPLHAQSIETTDTNDASIAKVRGDVMRLGVGQNARVEVQLRDTIKVKGYIEDAREDSFTVVDSKNGSQQNLAYADVVKVKRVGSGFSTRSWLILGGAVAGAVATWIIVKPALCDGGAQTRGPC